MTKVTIVQKNPFGPGTERRFVRWTKDLAHEIAKIERAYNMSATEILID